MPLDAPAHRHLARRPARGLRSRRSTSTADELRAQRACRSAPSCPRSSPRCTACATARSRSSPTPTCGYAANYLYMITGEVPEPEQRPGHRAVPDHHDRPRLQRLDVHRPGHHVDRRRPRRRGRRRHRRAVRPAARRRAEPGARHARRHRHARQRRRLGARRGRERRPDHGLRPPRLQDRRPALAACCGASPSASAARWPSFATQVEQTVVDVLAELKPGRELYANVEFYAGVVMDRCGLPRELFTPTFASSRVIGWCANILEQAADNRIIRPSARYVGPPPTAARPRPLTASPSQDPQIATPTCLRGKWLSHVGVGRRSGVEEAADLSTHGRGLLDHAAPGDGEQSPAEHLDLGPPDGIALERGGVQVVALAVELERHESIGPRQVDLRDGTVRRRRCGTRRSVRAGPRRRAVVASCGPSD